MEDDPDQCLALLDSGLKAGPDAQTRGFLLLNKALLLRERNQIPEAMVMLGELAVDPGLRWMSRRWRGTRWRSGRGLETGTRTFAGRPTQRIASSTASADSP